MIGFLRWLFGGCDHQPMLTQRRDKRTGDPVVPHAIDWICSRCQKVLGSTELVTKPIRMKRARRVVLGFRRSAA